MELKLIDGKGQASGTRQRVQGFEMFGRDYNEALIHQVVTGFMATMPARATRKPRRVAATVQQEHEEAVAPEGHRPRARRHGVQPAVAGRRQDVFPNLPEEDLLLARRSTARCTARACASILSQLASQGRLSVVDDFKLEQPKTKLLAQKR